MNIIDIQDHLKNFSEDQLINEMQMPSGMAPQFLVLSEIQRRKRVRDDFAKQNAAMEQTVAQEAVAAAGVPMEGIAGMSEAMAPQSAASDGIGSVMPQSMKQAVPQSLPSPTDDPIEMRSGGLMAYGEELSQRLAQKKEGKVNRFLDNVEQQAVSEFGFEATPETGGQVNEPKPAVIDETLEFDMFSNLFAPTNKGGGITPRPAVMPNQYGSPYARPISYYSDGGVIKAQDGLPRGLRLRNPGNIRPGAGFFGETGDDGGYAQFESEEAGLRALARLLNTYGSEYDINTVRGLVGRYAPKSDNPDSYENYIKYMSDQLGVGADEEFDLVGRRAEVIPAIVGFEQGKEYAGRYSPEMISGAISSSEEDDESAIGKILSAINPISSAEASTLTPTSQPVSTPMPDIPSDIVFDETGRPIGDASYGPRIRAAMETGNVDIADQLVAQGVNEANFFEQMMKNKDPDDLGAAATGMGAITTPIGPGTLSPADITQVLPLDPTQKTASGTTVEESVAEAEPAETSEPEAGDSQTTQPPQSNVTFLPGAGTQQSGLEAEIKKLQGEMEKSREQDKWLAIAQAGLALMSSKEPTLLGAAGEAGISGLTAFREAQDRYQEGVVDLINARAKLAKSDDEGGITASSAVSRINKIEELLNPTDPAAMPLSQDRVQALEEERRYLMREILQYPRITA